MSNYTITHPEPDPAHRTWHSGHCAVRRDGVTVALFVFDYPDSVAKLYGDESAALAAAKSFMAIDDLVAALSGLIRTIDGAGLLNLSRGVQLGRSSWLAKASDCMIFANEALEKAGIK